MKRKKKNPNRKIQDDLWELCKQLIRIDYQRKDGNWECYTCGKIITSKLDCHTGHFIPKSICGAYLKYDLRNLRPQCMSCNIWGGGRGADFYRNMLKREGQEYIDQLYRDKNKTIKAIDYYITLKDQYTVILSLKKTEKNSDV